MATYNKGSDWLIDQLMQRGLTYQQASSKGVGLAAEILKTDEDRLLMKDTRVACAEMMQDVKEAKAAALAQAAEAEAKVKEISDVVLRIKEAADENGGLTDERAKNALALYASLIDVGGKVNEEVALESAGYIVYAYLGGQAARNIQYSEESAKAYKKREQKLYNPFADGDWVDVGGGTHIKI